MVIPNQEPWLGDAKLPWVSRFNPIEVWWFRPHICFTSNVGRIDKFIYVKRTQQDSHQNLLMVSDVPIVYGLHMEPVCLNIIFSREYMAIK
jgi:hypothetical protein